MKSPANTIDAIGGPYLEETMLEAYNLEWKSIELRRQRLQKLRRQLLVTEKMEHECLRYQRQLRRLKRREQETEAREQMKRQQEETLRRQQEKKRAAVEQKKKKKQKKQTEMNGVQTDEDVPSKKVDTVKSKMLKTKIQPKQVKKTTRKRIAPITVPSLRPEDDESVTDENQPELGGHDSSPSELPDDGLLNLLSLDKGSDSDVDDEPSMVSLILPAAQDSPKLLPSDKKKSTPEKRFAKKRGGTPLDFDFTNAEAKRQAKAAEAAQNEPYESDKDDAEPEPMPSISTPKKRLKRRKEVAKDRQRANGVNASDGKTLMATMATKTIAIKPKKGVVNDDATTGTKVVRKKATENGPVSNGPLTKTKPKHAQMSVESEGKTLGLSLKKIRNGKMETMSIKQRLANVELLAQMNKMQDMNTPKVLGKKTKKTQKQEMGKTADAKRAEMRKVLSEVDTLRHDQMLEEGDLNFSLNSSGLISDNESPENIRAATRKRPVAVQEDVTPTKKLQFLEITKRLVKSPMPRFLRTPTPLASPMVPSAFVNQKAASPAPRAASARNTALNDYETRRLNSAPVRPKKTIHANRFGAPIGNAGVGAGGGSFSMFDAFVNSGTSGAIPRLRTKAQGNV